MNQIDWLARGYLCVCLLMVALDDFAADSGVVGAGSFAKTQGGDDSCKARCDRTMVITPNEAEVEVGQEAVLNFRAPVADHGDCIIYGGGEARWGDKPDSITSFATIPTTRADSCYVAHNPPFSRLASNDQDLSHIYKSVGRYTVSAQMSSSFKFDGGISCSYECRAQQVATIVVKATPALPSDASGANTSATEPRSSAWEKFLATDRFQILALIGMVILILLILVSVSRFVENFFGLFLLRLGAVFLGGYVGYLLPGVFNINLTWLNVTGALAFCVLVYLFNPPPIERNDPSSGNKKKSTDG